MTALADGDAAVAVQLLSARKRVSELEAVVRRPLARQQLELGVYQLLAALVDATDHKARVNELATLTGVTPAGVTRLVDRASIQGYVKRGPVEGDNRGVTVCLTPYGEQRLIAGTTAVADALRNHLAKEA